MLPLTTDSLYTNRKRFSVTNIYVSTQCHETIGLGMERSGGSFLGVFRDHSLARLGIIPWRWTRPDRPRHRRSSRRHCRGTTACWTYAAQSACSCYARDDRSYNRCNMSLLNGVQYWEDSLYMMLHSHTRRYETPCQKRCNSNEGER